MAGTNVQHTYLHWMVKLQVCDAQTENEFVRALLCMLMATMGNTAPHIHAISTHTFQILETVYSWPDHVSRCVHSTQ